jgi:hypothetical protein
LLREKFTRFSADAGWEKISSPSLPDFARRRFNRRRALFFGLVGSAWWGGCAEKFPHPATASSALQHV